MWLFELLVNPLGYFHLLEHFHNQWNIIDPLCHCGGALMRHQLIGLIAIADAVRPTSKATIAQLQQRGQTVKIETVAKDDRNGNKLRAGR